MISYGGLVTKSCLTLATQWTAPHQAPLPMEFLRQEYWSGLPFPSPEESSQPKDQTKSPALQADSLLTEPPGKPILHIIVILQGGIWWVSCSNIRIINGRAAFLAEVTMSNLLTSTCQFSESAMLSLGLSTQDSIISLCFMQKWEWLRIKWEKVLLSLEVFCVKKFFPSF